MTTTHNHPAPPRPRMSSCQGILDNWIPREIALATGAGMR